MKKITRNYLDWHFNPAYVLWLIRTEQVKSYNDLIHRFELYGVDTLTVKCKRTLERYLYAFEKLGLIKMVDGLNLLTVTSLVDQLQDVLRLSLLELAESVMKPSFRHRKNEVIDIDLFVLMPFNEKLKPVYEDHIKKVAATLELRVARADDLFTVSTIIDEIIESIYACEIVIADCTERNPNVFYEIGVADMLGKPVILLTQTLDDIPFDLRHRRHVLYEFTPRGMEQFESSLQKTIKTLLGRRIWDNTTSAIERI
jgi:nucleoside 2-deoxyribosyltransferase